MPCPPWCLQAFWLRGRCLSPSLERYIDTAFAGEIVKLVRTGERATFFWQLAAETSIYRLENDTRTFVLNAHRQRNLSNLFQSEVESWTSVGLPIFLVILVVFVIDYYVDSVCVNHLEMARTGRFSAMGTAVFGLLLSCVWNHPFISQVGISWVEVKSQSWHSGVFSNVVKLQQVRELCVWKPAHQHVLS